MAGLFESDTNSNFFDGNSNSVLSDNPNNVTETLLTLNRAYQEVIQEKINQLKVLLEQNRIKQAEVYEKSLKNTETSANAFKIGSSYKDNVLTHPNEAEIYKIKDNYFKDRFNSCPEDNPDTIYKSKLAYYDYLPQVKPAWTLEKRTKLKTCVMTDALRVIKAPFVSKKSYLEEKLVNFTLTQKRKDQDLSNVHRLLKEVNIQLKKIDNLSESDILAQFDESKIDWMKISKIDFQGQWSFNECRLMWKNVCHPSINQEKWSQPESHSLIELARKYNEKNWEQIAKELDTNRSAYLCMKRYHEKTADKYCKRDWTEEETKELCRLAELYQIGLTVPFNYLCYLNGTRDRNSIYNWYLKVNPQLNHGKWLDYEKQSFEEAIEYYKFNLNWQEISEYVGTRTALQCKERYELKYQYPEKYINWTLEEDKKLLDAVDEYGTHWVQIAQNVFPKRTDHSCLFRYGKLMNWQKQQEWFNNQPEEIREFMLFLFKRRTIDENNEIVENHNVYTNKGELVPTLPKFGPGTRNLNNIINTIYEKKDLVYEFIKKKREGQLSISLLNSIGIYTPLLNSVIAKCKKYHNIVTTYKKARVQKKPRTSKIGDDKKVRLPKVKHVNRPTKARIKKLKIRDTLEKMDSEKRAQFQFDNDFRVNVNIESHISSDEDLQIQRVVVNLLNDMKKRVERMVSPIRPIKILKQRGRKRKQDSTAEKSTVNKKYKKIKLVTQNQIENNNPRIESNRLPIIFETGILATEPISILPIESVPSNTKNLIKINQIIDTQITPLPILPPIPLEPIQSNVFNIINESSNSSTSSNEVIRLKSKKSVKIADLINFSEKNLSNSNIVLIDVTSSTENKSKPRGRTPKPSKQLISKIKPIEKDKDSNKMIRDIVGVTPAHPVNPIARTFTSLHSNSSITIQPISQTINSQKSTIKTPVCSIEVKFESIEDGVKIPCFMEQYNEFKYLYSLKKDSKSPKYFQKFTIIKLKDKLIAIKSVNDITDEWITDEKINALEKTLKKVLSS